LGLEAERATVLPWVEELERIAGTPRRIRRCIGWNASWYAQSFLPANEAGSRMFLDDLSSERDSWDGVVVCGPSTVLRFACQQASERGFTVLAQDNQVLPYVGLAGGWEPYWAGRGGNLRKNLRSLANRARRAGLGAGEAGTEASVDALMSRLFALHEQRWGQRGQASRYLEGTRRRRFLEELVIAACGEHRLWLPYLAAAGEVVAAALCFVDGAVIRYYLPAFDVSWARLSPGKLLLEHVLRTAAERGVREVDLGPGQDTYKAWWATGERHRARAMLTQGDLALWARYEVVPRLRRRGASGARRVLAQPALARHLPGRLRGFLDRGR
jgi:CelD/BcsL family acetyltransferase involved in cellulose biosynthesis